MILFVAVALIALTAGKTACASGDELLLQLNKELLQSTEASGSLPNPSVHIALRLSTHHNLLKESQNLNQLKTKLHDDIQSSINDMKPVVGRLALYVLALKASCQDLSSFTLSVNEMSEPLLTHLKKELETEKRNIASKQRPKTNYYQYSLGILALCVSGVRVSSHISHKLIHAVQHGQIKHDVSLCIDSHAMAGMALQCLKDARTTVNNEAELNKALATIKKKLLESERADGHMGNEFSTGLAVQALLAMGSYVKEHANSVEAMRADARKGTYHNPMAISQILPALQQRSYLDLKSKDCHDEDDSLIWNVLPVQPEVQSNVLVHVHVEVVKATGLISDFLVDVPSGSSLLKALTLLQDQQIGFTFEKEESLWGPFLSRVNGEWARQSDRRYWKISSDGNALKEGMGDYKIDADQKITIKNIDY
ncbi:transcobalamin-2 [Electrophorus electricus]|uniref:Transcobalamin-like C-terminal domain-containing protein n=1 Tax=Electrophorus electricus TaxID=8005 RepID=A0A4W4F4G7_ELEEL|nr:transcobalamin-2 [Electrophorus electricus]